MGECPPSPGSEDTGPELWRNVHIQIKTLFHLLKGSASFHDTHLTPTSSISYPKSSSPTEPSGRFGRDSGAGRWGPPPSSLSEESPPPPKDRRLRECLECRSSVAACSCPSQKPVRFNRQSRRCPLLAQQAPPVGIRDEETSEMCLSQG